MEEESNSKLLQQNYYQTDDNNDGMQQEFSSAFEIKDRYAQEIRQSSFKTKLGKHRDNIVQEDICLKIVDDFITKDLYTEENKELEIFFDFGPDDEEQKTINLEEEERYLEEFNIMQEMSREQSQNGNTEINTRKNNSNQGIGFNFFKKP